MDSITKRDPLRWNPPGPLHANKFAFGLASASQSITSLSPSAGFTMLFVDDPSPPATLMRTMGPYITFRWTRSVPESSEFVAVQRNSPECDRRTVKRHSRSACISPEGEWVHWKLVAGGFALALHSNWTESPSSTFSSATEGVKRTFGG